MSICPYCRKPVTLSDTPEGSKNSMPVTKQTVGFLKKEVMYSCPHCKCVLGFAYFFGGWSMGRPK